MKIEIDQAIIEEAVQETALKAFTDSLSGWEVKTALGKVLNEQIADGLEVVGEALRLAMERINLSSLATALAGEMERAATAAVVGILQVAFVETVLRLRGVNLYHQDEATAKARALVKAELFGRRE